MKLEVTRYSVQIIPQGPQDEAFLEEVLGLRAKGDSVPLVRVSPIGLDHSIAYAEAKRSK